MTPAPDSVPKGSSSSPDDGADRDLPLRQPRTAVRERTIADVARSLAPGWTCEDVFAWPPDGFAFASAVLEESGAYRLIVSPPPGRRWPPNDPASETWENAVRRWAAEWTAWVVEPRPGRRRPGSLARLVSAVRGSSQLPLVQLDEPRHCDTLVALLTLHAMADEACRGLGVDRRGNGLLHAWATDLLLEKGSLSRFAATRARVLPKSTLPRTGITIRSLSRHVGLDRSETNVRWYRSDGAPSPLSRFTLLLVPYPARISPADFRAIHGPLDNMDPDRFGFFEFAPRTPLDVDAVLRIVDAGRAHVGRVDAVVLPESVLRHEEADHLRRSLHSAGVPHLVAGVRQHASSRSGFGANYAYVTGTVDGTSWAEVQHKHHRWSLDDSQILQYHLERRLHPGRRWWEAIGIERRDLMFVTIDESLTLCPLICEDLAQPDPVASIIRRAGPSLVIGLLLDGPQLAERWPARYASVLADDPGSAVLTLTSLGMAQRSRPSGCSPSRSVALWRDADTGIRELSLEEGAAAVAVTVAVHHRFGMTADGRSVPTTHLLLEDVRQVVDSSPSGLEPSRRRRVSPGTSRGGRRRRDGLQETIESASTVSAPDVRSEDAVFVCDRSTRIVSWNRALEKLTGISARRAVGRHCHDVIRGTDEKGRPVCMENCVVAEYARSGRPLSCPPLFIKTRRGSRQFTISTLIVREGAEPLVVHLAREESEAAAEADR